MLRRAHSVRSLLGCFSFWLPRFRFDRRDDIKKVNENIGEREKGGWEGGREGGRGEGAFLIRAIFNKKEPLKKDAREREREKDDCK